MKKKNSKSSLMASLAIVLAILACNVPLPSFPSGGQETTPTMTSPAPSATATNTPLATAGAANPLPTFVVDTPTPILTHGLIPTTGDVKTYKHILDTVSKDTASEKRAPTGDSYKLNRFERPFLQDMTYVSDLDIASYSFGADDNFFFISIELVGANPNNPLGINYGVEIDLDGDGFGDKIIWAHPPYNVEWTTDNVQIFADKNHDTGGLSAEKSDAPIPGDGYETLIFNGGRGEGDDPDLAWVRVNAGRLATVQFAFKKSVADDRFIYGVIADGGLKDIGKMDYIDRFTEFEAGSPERGSDFYPLKELYAIDNVCRETYGFVGSGQEPQLCPRPNNCRECQPNKP
jgi:hypothetical protein